MICNILNVKQSSCCTVTYVTILYITYFNEILRGAIPKKIKLIYNYILYTSDFVSNVFNEIEYKWLWRIIFVLKAFGQCKCWRFSILESTLLYILRKKILHLKHSLPHLNTSFTIIVNDNVVPVNCQRIHS